MRKEEEKKKRNKKKKSKLFLSTCFFAIAASLFYQVIVEFSQTLVWKKDISNKTQELNKIKEDYRKLEKEKQNLQDPNYVENYARGKYMATKNGEQVFILPDDSK